jgi:hypothetical protein
MTLWPFRLGRDVSGVPGYLPELVRDPVPNIIRLQLDRHGEMSEGPS